jgi:hypothetical protein
MAPFKKNANWSCHVFAQCNFCETIATLIFSPKFHCAIVFFGQRTILFMAVIENYPCKKWELYLIATSENSTRAQIITNVGISAVVSSKMFRLRSPFAEGVEGGGGPSDTFHFIKVLGLQ